MAEIETKDRLDAALAQVARLRAVLSDVLTDIDDLINQSEGVAGLHFNGDVAPWADLLPGGRYETWLATVADARAALAETGDTPSTPPAYYGWTAWEGGECPVPKGTMLDVRFRGGTKFRTCGASELDWDNDGWYSDIVAYRIVEAHNG